MIAPCLDLQRVNLSTLSASTSLYDFLEPPTEPDDLGMLGHYRVISELGRGGMGFVFRAEDIKLKRTVALKVMNQKIAAIPNSRKRFLSEARSMAAVHHDNVVTIFEVGESNGTPFMAMEMLAGQTLEAYNKLNPNLGFEAVIEFATQIARGLEAAHSKGIIHRDIKPANIWIQEGTSRIKILDFGLALASTPVDQLAGRGAVIGTPGYLSPEQARSDPMDDRSDLYSLGVVLYEMCTGKLPIQSKSVPGQLVSILAHRPRPISELNPAIPKPLCDLVHRLLRKEPRSRISSAVRLQKELKRVGEECEKTTETAQAINRLKEGLSDVVTKKSSVSSFDSIDEVEVIHDPLASLPSSSTLLNSAVTGVPAPHLSRPINPHSPSRAKTGAQPQSSLKSQIYLPIAAIAAVVLIALPILTYFFSSAGRSTEAYIVQADPDSYAASDSTDPPVAPEPAAPPATVSKPTTPTNRSDESKGPSAESQKMPVEKSDAELSNSPETTPSRNVVASMANPSKDTTAAPTSPPDESAPTTEPSDADSDSTDDGPVPPAAEEIIESRWEVISTEEGRGGDAMVQNGGVNEKLGTRPSIGVRTRSAIPVNHSYVRFDLSKVNDAKDEVIKAGLILTIVGSKRPAGATVQVYGITDVGMWDESKLVWEQTPSFDASPKKLDQFPLLAEVTVSEEGDVEDQGKNQLRISDPRFADFIAKSDGLVTFALTGEYDQALLRFFSREKSPSEAPQLLVEVPVELGKSKKRN